MACEHKKDKVVVVLSPSWGYKDPSLFPYSLSPLRPRLMSSSTLPSSSDGGDAPGGYEIAEQPLTVTTVSEDLGGGSKGMLEKFFPHIIKSLYFITDHWEPEICKAADTRE